MGWRFLQRCHWGVLFSHEGLAQQLSKDFKEIQESIDSVSQRVTRLETKASDSKQSIAITTESQPKHMAEPMSLKEHVAEPTPQKQVESLGTPADLNAQSRTGDLPWDEHEDLPNYEELIY